jgi:hypothetical protein
MPKGTASKEMVGTRSYGKKLFFMVKFPKFLGSPTYNEGIRNPKKTCWGT